MIPIPGDDTRVFYIMAFTKCERCGSAYVLTRDVLCSQCRKFMAQPVMFVIEEGIKARLARTA